MPEAVATLGRVSANHITVRGHLPRTIKPSKSWFMVTGKNGMKGDGIRAHCCSWPFLNQ